MNTRRSRIATVAAILVVALSALRLFIGATPVLAEDGPTKITIKLTDSGFEPNNIEVTQGQLVELTFVWDSPARPLDEHIMVIPGYKLESGKINSDHKETTVKFIATQSGTFNFKCDLMCDTHDLLQKGQITVKPAAGGTTGASLQPSKLVVDPVSGVVIKGGTVSLSAALQDKDGNPIPRAEVRFYAEETFLGRTGLIDIGAAKTGASGSANLLYHPRSDATRKIVAKFAGVGLYDATEQTIQLVGSAQFGPRVGANPDDTLHGIKGGAHLALISVIAGVWLMFGFIAFQAWGISRVKSPGADTVGH